MYMANMGDMVIFKILVFQGNPLLLKAGKTLWTATLQQPLPPYRPRGFQPNTQMKGIAQIGVQAVAAFYNGKGSRGNSHLWAEGSAMA